MSEEEWDRDLLAQFLTREVARYGSWSEMIRATKTPRATLYRMKAGDPTVKRVKWLQLGAALGLPMDAIDAIALRDCETARELGLPDDLILWMGRQSGHQAT